jgi:LmbE family N-acetylglucosaminyl deacetylase
MSQTVLTIFAHPDDAETMAGGLLLTWAREGRKITLCIITDGDKGTADPNDTSATVIARRRAEQVRAAARLGAEVVYLGYEDGMLQPTLELRRDLVRVMRRVRPDVVVAGDPTVWFRHGRYINHPDHRAAAQAAVEALYPAVKKPHIFPELMAEGLLPHVVTEVLLGPTEEPDFHVDIAPVLDEKIALIVEHSSQFEPAAARAAFTRMAKDAGASVGLEAAESYRRLRLSASTVRSLAGISDERKE